MSTWLVHRRNSSLTCEYSYFKLYYGHDLTAVLPSVYMNIKELEDIGLSTKEAQVYLATLMRGNTTALSISRKAKLPKTTTADILASLVKQKLVSKYTKGRKNYYTTLDPAILSERVAKQQDTLQKLLPQLKAMHESRVDRPKVRFYEGNSEYISVLKELVRETSEVLVIASTKDTLSSMPTEYLDLTIKERLANKVLAKALYTNDPNGLKLKSDSSQELRVTKIIQPSLPFTSMIWVWNNKVAFFDVKNEVNIFIIESLEIAQTMRMMFQSMWEHEPEVK